MKLRDILVLITLMVIGEFIFLLPFVVTRVFRPTFLTVFEINNLQLGSAFSLYGIVAMISYFAGGPIADRFSPRKLLPVSFLTTAAAGFIMATIPSIWMLTLLYGFWGLTTILLFWAGYVKAQREFGGAAAQGKTFGMMDAGRGLVAAMIASSSVVLLGFFLPASADLASKEELTAALSKIIMLFSVITASGALFVWFFLKDEKFEKGNLPRLSLKGISTVIRKPVVWMQAFIVLCSYVGYKCTDDFSLYAKDTFGFDDVFAAHIATISFWTRPVAAVLAGFLGDRFIHSRVISVCFIIMFIGSVVISAGLLEANMILFIGITIASVSVGIYGLRGLYFALFQEARLPLVITGSAAGFVSVIGYTPDIFMGPLMGVILDNNPGALGHQYLFGMLAGFALAGFVISLLFRRAASQAFFEK